jgi:hypothetical protein
LVECDGRESEGQIWEDNVEAHRGGQRDEILDGRPTSREECELGSREDVEGKPCDEEVEGGEGELAELPLRVGKDGFVGEDLRGKLAAADDEESTGC